jgi:hypothetical protein
MKYALIAVLAVLLIFGCIGGGSGTKNKTEEIPTIPKPGDIGINGNESNDTNLSACQPSQSFSALPDGTFAKNAHLFATVSCLADKEITVKINGAEVRSTAVTTNETQQVELVFAPPKDGTVNLTVEIERVPVYSKEWKVKPLGSEDVRGLEYDPVSFKEWRAMAIDIDTTITPGRVKAYMKRIAAKTKPQTIIIAEMRSNVNGNPAGLLASARRPINATTLSENWVSFDFQSKPTLQPGRYWIIFKIEQTEDVDLISDTINIRFVTADKQVEANDYTREMRLSVDRVDGVASETQWQPLTYNKTYAIVLTSN